MMPLKERRLTRTKVRYLPAGKTPYREERLPDGRMGSVTNSRPVYVQRGKGLPMQVRTKPGEHNVVSLTNDELELVRVVAKKRKWKLIERRADIVIKPADRFAHLTGDLDCDTALLDRLELVARDLGVTILVRSGRRTMDEQWALYNLLGPAIAAYPSHTAPHVRGIAADCGINGVNIGAHPGARKAMLAHGLCLRVPNEAWHVECGGRDRWASNWLPS